MINIVTKMILLILFRKIVSKKLVIFIATTLSNNVDLDHSKKSRTDLTLINE